MNNDGEFEGDVNPFFHFDAKLYKFRTKRMNEFISKHKRYVLDFHASFILHAYDSLIYI